MYLLQFLSTHRKSRVFQELANYIYVLHGEWFRSAGRREEGAWAHCALLECMLQVGAWHCVCMLLALCPLISSIAAQLSDAGAYTFSIIVALFPTLPIGLVGLGEQPSARLPFCCTPPLPLVGV